MQPTRRTLLKTGTTAAIGAAFAGCLDGTGDDAANDQADQRTDLAIEHIRLVAEQPDGRREYEAVSDGIYQPDELIWIYYEPVGLSTADSGSGEERIETTLELDIEGPDGETLDFEEEIARDIHEGATDEQYFYWSFQPELPVTSGEYVATLQVRDEIAEESVTETVQFTIEQEGPVIDHIRFVEDQPHGYRQYTEVPDETYQADEVIWMYYEPSNLMTEDAGGNQVRYDVMLELEVIDPAGAVWEFEEPLEQTVDQNRFDELFFFWNFQPDVPVLGGEYEAVLRVTDELRGESVERSVQFSIESDWHPDHGHLETYEHMLSVGLQIEIETLVVQDGAVEIDYSSYFQLTTGESEFEIGFIAGRFADQIAEGWDVSELVVALTDAAGNTYQYTVNRTTAQAWNQGDITTEEFTSQVINSLVEVEE